MKAIKNFTLLLLIFISIAGNSLAKSTPVGVLADIEGDWERFVHYVNYGDTLIFNNRGEVELKDNMKFVFLGDSVDKGNGSIRIMQSLLALKEKYPTKVTLILGNRDIVKMKIPYLISDEALWEKHLPYYNTPVSRLKWLITKKLGGANSWNFRGEELKVLFPERTIDDKAIFDSFIEGITPDGLFARYLQQGELAKIIDQTLYLHGAVSADSAGYLVDGKTFVEDPREWVEKLNEWTKKEISSWYETQKSNKALLNEGRDLIEYSLPVKGTKKNDSSIVYGRFSDDTGNPRAPPEKVLNYFKEGNINRIVVGHTPNAIPIPINKSGVEIIMADCSNNRLHKAPKIIFYKNKTFMQGLTPDGLVVTYAPSQSNMKLLGKKAKDGFRIVGKNEEGQYALLKVSLEDAETRSFSSKIVTSKNPQLKVPQVNRVNTAKCEELLKVFAVK